MTMEVTLKRRSGETQRVICIEAVYAPRRIGLTDDNTPVVRTFTTYDGDEITTVEAFAADPELAQVTLLAGNGAWIATCDRDDADRQAREDEEAGEVPEGTTVN